MAYGDLLTSLAFETNISDRSLSDRSDSDEEISDEEEKPSLFRSIFSFWGFGSKSKTSVTKPPVLSSNSETSKQGLEFIKPTDVS
jgi:hypothetical protein